MTQPQIFLVLPGVWPCKVPPSRSRTVFCQIWSTMELGVWAVIWSHQSGINVPIFGWSGILEFKIVWVLLQFDRLLFRFCHIESFVTIRVFSTICIVTIWVCHTLSFVLIGVFVTIWVVTPTKNTSLFI